MSKRRLIGRGWIWNADGNPGKMSSFENVKLSWDTQTLEVPGDEDFSTSSFDVMLGTKCTLEFAYHSFDAASWALATGGTTTASLSLHTIQEETFTVPSAPGAYTVTATNTPLKQNAGATITLARVYAKSTDGDVTEMSQITGGSEVATESYSVVAATGVFTFAAGDADVVYYCDYMYTGTAGTRVRLNRDDLPSEFEFIGVVDATTLGGLIEQPVHITNVAPSMPDGWGATRGGHDPISITCGVKGENIDWYFND